MQGGLSGRARCVAFCYDRTFAYGHLQSMAQAQRYTEIGATRGWHGATWENTGSMRPR